MKTSLNKSSLKLLSAIILVLGIITIVISTVSATDYYINPWGDDSNSGFSISDSKQSIGNAIETASSGDTIFLSNGIYRGLMNRDITIDKNLSFIGESKENTIIDAENQGRIFNILSGLTVNFVNITFRNGFAIDGGAIYNKESSLTITHCVFEDNEATGRGGAIFNERSYNVKIVNTVFQKNKATINGSAVYNFYCSKGSIELSQFLENHASNSGGAVFNEYGHNLEVLRSNFINNLAENCGGAIYNFYANKVTIAESLFKTNKAISGSGGAVFNEQGDDFTMIKCEFIENTAAIYGGAVDIFHADGVKIVDNIFTDNKASFGGAIFNEQGADLIIKNCDFIGNEANQGAVLYNFYGVGISMFLPTFKNNKVSLGIGEILFNEDGRKILFVLYEEVKSIFNSRYIYSTISNEITVEWLEKFSGTGDKKENNNYDDSKDKDDLNVNSQANQNGDSQGNQSGDSQTNQNGDSQGNQSGDSQGNRNNQRSLNGDSQGNQNGNNQRSLNENSQEIQNDNSPDNLNSQDNNINFEGFFNLIYLFIIGLPLAIGLIAKK